MNIQVKTTTIAPCNCSLCVKDRQQPCWVAQTLGLDDCDGRRDGAHIGFTRHWLSKAPTGPKLTKEQASDPRIIRPVCRRHHQSLDFGKLDLARSQIPSTVFDFATEFGLLGKLDREYPILRTDHAKTKERNDAVGGNRPIDSTSSPGRAAPDEDALRRASGGHSPNDDLSLRRPG